MIEGVLLTLGDTEARKGAAYMTAKGILAGGKFSVRMDSPEPSSAQVAEVVEALHGVLPKLRSPSGQFHGMHGLETATRKRALTKGKGASTCPDCSAPIPSPEAPCPSCGTLQEAPIAPTAPTPVPTPPAKAGPKAQQKNSKAVGRTGKPVTGPGSPAGAAFNEKHPRGPGGKFAQKGDGTGAGGPKPEVAQLQRRLRQLGYGPGAADGSFGPLTEGAVKSFQADYGLQQTGKIDPATAQVMAAPPAQKLSQVQAQNRAIAAMPNALGQVPKGKATATAAGGTSRSHMGGAAGSGSTLTSTSPAAVKAFQSSHGLTPDGIIGPKTLAALQSSSGGSRSSRGTSAKGGTGKAGVATPGVGGTSRGGVKGTAKGTPGVVGTGRHQVLSQGAGMTGKPNLTVKTIQAQLTQLGYDLGSRGADGRFGLYTEQAIRKLQREHGLKADGKVGARTRRLLKRLLKHSKTGLSGDQLQASREQRQMGDVKRRLEESVSRRLEAERTGDATAFIHARAEEGVLRDRLAAGELQEFFGRGGGTVNFDPQRHPRDRAGKFAEVMGALKVGQHAKIPGGVEVHRTPDGFEVRGKGLQTMKAGSANEAYGHAMDAYKAKVIAGHVKIPLPSSRGSLGPSPLQRLQKAQKAEAAAHALRHAEGSVADALCLRLEEAAARRVAATSIEERLAARAMEVSIAGQIMEGKAISAHERKKYGTVGDKFPIPPAGHPRAKAHAKAALARLDQAKPPLTPAEKAKVKAKAKRVLAEVRDVGAGPGGVGMSRAGMSPDAHPIAEAADTAMKASTHEPVGHGGKNWITKMGEQLPAYIQRIANDLIEKRGKAESVAIRMAIGIVKRWARGGGNVHAEVKAAASKAVAEWEALKAKNAAKGASSSASKALQQAMAPRWSTTGVEVEVDGLVLCEAVEVTEAYGPPAAAFVAELHPRDRSGRFSASEILQHTGRMFEGQRIYLGGSNVKIRKDRGAGFVVSGGGSSGRSSYGTAEAAAQDAVRRHDSTLGLAPDGTPLVDTSIAASVVNKLAHRAKGTSLTGGSEPTHAPFSIFGSLSPKVRAYYAAHPQEAAAAGLSEALLMGESMPEDIDSLQARMQGSTRKATDPTHEALAGPVSQPVPGSGAPGRPVAEDEVRFMPLNALAEAIDNDWENVSFAARPYLDAMRSMRSATQPFGFDPGPVIVGRFLSNAGGYQGSTATVIKRELKRRLDAAEAP